MRPFSLLVKPASADCNLRCTYCFYLGKEAIYPNVPKHRMSVEVMRRMISSFLKTDQPQYAFGWQGGEPTLMGLDFFKDVTACQQEFGTVGAMVSNGLQTNTTLIDDAWAEHLARYNFLVGVSIDGPAEVHNRYRRYVDGRGSHEFVMEGLAALKRRGAEYNVLTLVSRANISRPRETYRYLCDMGVYYHQYIECVEFDENGDLRPFAVNGEEWGDFLCAIFDEWLPTDTRKVSIRLFDSILTMMVDGVANCCNMGQDCRQYLVVEHNGDVYPCDFFVEPDLKLGNITENSWEEMLDSPLYEEFGKRKSQWNVACKSCPYLRYCAGCCPKNRPLRGRDPGRLSVLCEGWKRFYNHALPGLEKLADQIRSERSKAALAQPERKFAEPRTGKVGRNDPCPCGSGRKFKKCCG